MLSDTIHTVVSQPGPAESVVLARMAGIARPGVRVGAEVRLRVLEAGAASGGPTVVLLHGRGHAATIWARQIEHLAGSHRVLALDLPGFGHSASGLLGDGVAGALRFFVDPVAEVVREERDVILVGHSLGGLVAVEVAARLGDQVRGLALVAPMGFGTEVMFGARAYLRAGPERLARYARALGMQPKGASGKASDLELRALRQELLCARGGRPRAKQAFDRLLPLWGPAFAVTHLLPQLNHPTLIMAGSDDPAFPLPVFMRAASRMQRATLQTLRAGHSPHLECPDDINLALETFIRTGAF